MTYQETLDYLYGNLPMYQRIGAAAFKKDLTNAIALCEALGNPHKQFKSIHIAGTNGKGSSSHMIAAALQCSGAKVGLYTSPHLKSFTERIKINGKEIDEASVIGFVAQHRKLLDDIKPSFFEMTVAMAFDYFARLKVDFAVIEVGLGGRFDSTNIIIPELSLITNISYDHQAMLGETLPEIAFEKAGIIKSGVPVVISEYQPEISGLFMQRAEQLSAPIFFASHEYRTEIIHRELDFMKLRVYKHNNFYGEIETDLTGDYQLNNIPGVLKSLEILKEKYPVLTESAIKTGISKAKSLTGLKGRWQILCRNPLVICDTGHNQSGFEFVVRQLSMLDKKKLWIVFGMVQDKPAEKILGLLPKHAYYYFCEAKIPRALDAVTLYEKAQKEGLSGEIEKDVNTALNKAIANAGNEDVVFVGGSTFVVAEIKDL